MLAGVSSLLALAELVVCRERALYGCIAKSADIAACQHLFLSIFP